MKKSYAALICSTTFITASACAADEDDLKVEMDLLMTHDGHRAALGILADKAKETCKADRLMRRHAGKVRACTQNLMAQLEYSLHEQMAAHNPVFALPSGRPRSRKAEHVAAIGAASSCAPLQDDMSLCVRSIFQSGTTMHYTGAADLLPPGLEMDGLNHRLGGSF